MRALRRDPMSAESFPQDVLELQAYLGDESRVAGVHAVPGRGTNVPLYILGSSLFGARLAAMVGPPFAFASHFAPAALQEAVAIYRTEFQASAQLAEPHVMAGVNVVAADTQSGAESELHRLKLDRVSALYGRGGRKFTDEEAEQVLRSPAGQHIEEMVTYAAVGTPGDVKDYLEQFAKHADADELIPTHHLSTTEARLRSVELLAEAMGGTGEPTG